jgi:multidrug efflux system outer membrane protein
MSKLRISIALVALGLCACTFGPDYVRPSSKLPAAYVNANDARYRPERANPKFWQTLGNSYLTELVERALDQAFDVRVAQATYEEAVARRREIGISGLPELDLLGSKDRSKQSAETFFGPSEFTKQTTYDVGFDFSWELDFFGAARRYREQIRAETEAGAARLADAKVMIAAETVRAFAEFMSFRTQAELTRANIENLRRSLELVRALEEAGRGTALDVARAEALFEATQASLPIIEDQAEKALGRIAYLSATSSYDLGPTLLAASAQTEIPDQLAIGAPDQLLKRRPDVVAAERELAALTARIGVDTGLLFPRVSFEAGAGFNAEQLDDLGRSATERYQFGPRFTFGALEWFEGKARVEQSNARVRAQLARYEGIVMRSLQEAENSLSGLVRMNRARLANERQLAASTRAAELASLRFEAGASDFLAVLDAERARIGAESQLAQARANEVIAYAALYKALGGSFLETEQ